MNNPIEMIVRNIIQKNGGNIQVAAQNILRNNPQFAQRLQGQNLQKMGMDGLRQAGINPQTFMNGMFNENNKR